MSEIRPIIFISHATRRANFNARTKEVREEITRLLEAEGWDVFVDEERLKAGDLWRPEILNSLSVARAGIILFDETAVKESEWVEAEALIMCFRQAIDPNFKLIPVFFKPCTLKDEYFNKYRPFQLGEISYVEDDDSDAVPAKIIEKLDIESAKALLSENIWIRKFELMLRSLLKADKIDINTLYESWYRLKAAIQKSAIELPGAPVFKEHELIRAVIQLMHHLEFSQIFDAYEAIKDKSLIPRDDETTINEFIKVKWVQNNWVEVFFRSSRRFKDKLLLVCPTPAVGVPNRLDYIKCFLDRLRYEKGDSAVMTLTVSDNAGYDDQAILRHIEEEISVRFDSFYEIESDDHAKFINDARDKWLCVIYIPQALAKSGVLEKLLNRYPRMIFLIQAENPGQNTSFSALDSVPGMRFEVLEPSLTIENISEFSRANSRFKNR